MVACRNFKSRLCELVILLRKNSIFVSSLRAKDAILSGECSTTSVDAMPGLHPRQRRAAWRVATTLLLATILGNGATTTTAMQTPGSIGALLDKARGEENAGNYDAAEN